MKYIDAEKLYKQVDERMAHFAELEKETKPDDENLSIFYQGKVKMCSELLGIIDSLQQPEDVVTTANALFEALSKTPYNNKPITADCLLQIRKKLKEYYPKQSLLCTPATSTNLDLKQDELTWKDLQKLDIIANKLWQDGKYDKNDAQEFYTKVLDEFNNIQEQKNK